MIRAALTGLPPAVTVPLTTGRPPLAGVAAGVASGDEVGVGVGVGVGEVERRGVDEGVAVGMEGVGVALLVRVGVAEGRPDAAA